MLDGRTVENKGKLILTEIFPSVQNMIFKCIKSLDPNTMFGDSSITGKGRVPGQMQVIKLYLLEKKLG